MTRCPTCGRPSVALAFDKGRRFATCDARHIWPAPTWSETSERWALARYDSLHEADVAAREGDV